MVKIPKRDTFKPTAKTNPEPPKKTIKKPVLTVVKADEKNIPNPQPQTPTFLFLKPTEPIQIKAETKVPDRGRIFVASFNRKSLGFSKVVNMASDGLGADKKDLNTTLKWPVQTDENTYPTDLTRVVTKEKFISAILNNKIDSTLPGKVLLIIDHNIYGSKGNKILVPIGTKASGTYAPIEKIGIERLSILIERMVTPDGQLILFKKPATVADRQGATGVKGDVDHKYLQKFGLPLIFSVANNTSNLAFQKLIDTISSDEESSLSKIFDEQWSKDQSQTNREIIAEILKNNINIMPTITIPAGQKILLYLEHDIWFKPNKNGVTEVVEASI